MTSRWDVERAVLYSALDAPARLVMLVLLAKSDHESAVVPEDHSPSLSTLSAATGLSRSTVAKHLNDLDRTGWVKRARPPKNSRDERTAYALCVPSSPGDGLPVVREPDYSSSPGNGLVRETDHSPTAETEPVVRETDHSSPGAGHATTKDKTLSSSTKNSARAPRKRASTPKPEPGTETEGQRVNRLARIYTDRVSLCKFDAVAGVVRTAVRKGVSDELLTRGLNTLADENRTVSLDTLRYAIYGPPKSHFQQRAPDQPYRNPADPSAYDDYEKGPRR